MKFYWPVLCSSTSTNWLKQENKTLKFPKLLTSELSKFQNQRNWIASSNGIIEPFIQRLYLNDLKIDLKIAVTRTDSCNCNKKPNFQDSNYLLRQPKYQFILWTNWFSNLQFFCDRFIKSPFFTYLLFILADSINNFCSIIKNNIKQIQFKDNDTVLVNLDMR